MHAPNLPSRLATVEWSASYSAQRSWSRAAKATSIIEQLQARYPGPARLIPDDADLAVEVRMLDRVFDNYVMTPQGKRVFDAIRPEVRRGARKRTYALVASVVGSYSVAVRRQV